MKICNQQSGGKEVFETPTKFFTESDIIELVKANKSYANPRIYDVEVRRNFNDEDWLVTFSTRNRDIISTKCKIRKKVGKERTFRRLNGVEKFCREVGIAEFKVIL